MSKVHCVGEHRSDETTGFRRVVRATLYGVMMSLERVRRYCGIAPFATLRDWSMFLTTIVLPMAYIGAPVGAYAQDVPDVKAAWVSEAGTASYYGNRHQGKRTASGKKFDQHGLTAAHRWLPFGTKVRVTALGTGKAVIVTITDRLYSNRRVIDLSTAAAEMLGMLRAGVAQVSLSPG
jgi:rare lipoprotein A